MNLFNINFNNNENEFLSLAYRCRKDGAVPEKFDSNGVYLFSIKKHCSADKILVYREQSMAMQEFFQILQNLLATDSIDIVAGDFNCNLLKRSETNF